MTTISQENMLSMMVATAAEMVRPVIGTSEEATLHARLCERLVAGWQHSPIEARLFVTTFFEQVRNGAAD